MSMLLLIATIAGAEWVEIALDVTPTQEKTGVRWTTAYTAITSQTETPPYYDDPNYVDPVDYEFVDVTPEQALFTAQLLDEQGEAIQERALDVSTSPTGGIPAQRVYAAFPYFSIARKIEIKNSQNATVHTIDLTRIIARLGNFQEKTNPTPKPTLPPKPSRNNEEAGQQESSQPQPLVFLFIIIATIAALYYFTTNKPNSG